MTDNDNPDCDNAAEALADLTGRPTEDFEPEDIDTPALQVDTFHVPRDGGGMDIHGAVPIEELEQLADEMERDINDVVIPESDAEVPEGEKKLDKYALKLRKLIADHNGENNG